MIASKLAERLGEPVIVDNRGGANGIIGTDLAVKAAPDGYTLLMGSVSTMSINPTFYPKLPYNTVVDLAPISLVASTPSMLVVNPGIPAKTVKELVALAKGKPRQLAFASAGNGSSHHLGGELFKLMAGVDMIHVPYKGTGPAIIDLVSGQVSMIISNIPSVLPMVKAEKLRALAVTSLRRSSIVPDLPTVAESGLPGYEVEIWYGVLAPAGISKPIVARLNGEMKRVLDVQDVKEKLASQGADALSSTREEFAQRIKADMAKRGKVVKVSGARPD
jgi:tripartite-type tricarboxylate transporter receptor subunit TctC